MYYFGKTHKYDLNNQLAVGGEGAVWSVRDRNDVVAKIYHPEKLSSDARLEKKIIYMVNNPPSDTVLDQIAWPMDVLRDSGGNFFGFIMPKLDTDTDLKSIYPYPPKKNMSITIEQKLIIAINICIVISEVHKAGYIFGDFNPLNIGIKLKNGHVAFFDADSYHFTDSHNGETYRCAVGADGYIAPELIQKCHDYNTDYLNVPLPSFTKETDEFALAIHVFKLLMNGYTPFNGIKESESASQSSPGTGNSAIERNNYCFKPGNKPQSPATPDISYLSPSLQFLFKRSFIDGASKPENRGSAEEYLDVLIEYKDNIVKCTNNPMHYYYVNNKNCPYCEADARYNQALAGVISTYSTGSRGSSVSQYSYSSPVVVPQNNNYARAGIQGQPAGNGQNLSAPPQKTVSKGNLFFRLLKILILIILVLCCGLYTYVELESTFSQKSREMVIQDLLFSRGKNKIDEEGVSDAGEISSFGTEILNLKHYAPVEEENIEREIPEDFAPDKNWDNALIYCLGEYAYATYALEGKFDKLTLGMQPYNYGGNFRPDTSVELQLVDLEREKVIYKEMMSSEDLPHNIEVNIAGVDNLRIMIKHVSGGKAWCLLNDIYVYPGNGNTLVETIERSTYKYSLNEKNLKVTTPYFSQQIDDDISLSYTYNDQLWNNALKFRPGNGENDACAVWEIGGGYSTLSFEYVPYDKEEWMIWENHVIIEVINEETKDVLYSNEMDCDTEITEVTIDVTGVNYLKINTNSPTGCASCLISDIYVYN